ncbi:MAG: S8 family serine peptidase [Flavobacterium sp.]|nr:S8 family serine peptidase [Flavobacterium sp.]
MKRILLFTLLFISAAAFSQEDAWVYFNAKADVETYLANPLTMLSQRALDRRTNQNIGLDFKDVPIDESYITLVGNQPGITVMAKSKWLNAIHVRGAVADIQALSALAFVASLDFADDSLDSSSGGRSAYQNRNTAVNKNLDIQANFNYGNSNNQIEMLNGHLLHQQDYTGAGKIIAVIDAGFPSVNTVQPFQRLFDNNLILGGYNFVSRNNDFYSANPHGTAVLSTMGGYTNNALVGTAPDAAYYLFITEDSAAENPVEESLWVEAAETADSLGVDVINTSLGYFLYDNPAYSYTYEDMTGTKSFISRGADIAFSRGMVVVVAAGNSGDTVNPYVGSPGDAINVLTVGAVDATEQYVSFSSIGPSFDGRIKPDVMAKGLAATLSDSSGTITTANGTSFASPIMAGMVASLWQALPEKTNSEIVELIKQSANFYANPNAQYGYGIPDFSLALSNGLSVKDNDKNEFLIYPNPVESQLSFIFPSAILNAEITFYNVLGQEIMIKSVSVQNPSISVSGLNAGIYWYKINALNFSQSGKLLKK